MNVEFLGKLILLMLAQVEWAQNANPVVVRFPAADSARQYAILSIIAPARSGQASALEAERNDSVFECSKECRVI
jgi:hypothetical protein